MSKAGDMCSICRPGSYTSKRLKVEEERIVQLLESMQIPFIREHRISFCGAQQGNTTFALLDFLIEQLSRRIIVSVDERQHDSWSGYEISCELARMADVCQAIALEDNSRPLLWVRYNPNAYRVDGELCKTGRGDRQLALSALLRDGTSTGIVYMYYDVDESNQLIIAGKDGYDSVFHATYVTKVIT